MPTLSALARYQQNERKRKRKQEMISRSDTLDPKPCKLLSVQVKHQLNERKRKQEMIMEMAMQIDKVRIPSHARART